MSSPATHPALQIPLEAQILGRTPGVSAIVVTSPCPRLQRWAFAPEWRMEKGIALCDAAISFVNAYQENACPLDEDSVLFRFPPHRVTVLTGNRVLVAVAHSVDANPYLAKSLLRSMRLIRLVWPKGELARV